jgi:hypothetical protein
VAWVLVNAVPVHNVGVDEPADTVLFGVTVIFTMYLQLLELVADTV